MPRPSSRSRSSRQGKQGCQQQRVRGQTQKLMVSCMQCFMLKCDVNNIFPLNSLLGALGAILRIIYHEQFFSYDVNHLQGLSNPAIE